MKTFKQLNINLDEAKAKSVPVDAATEPTIKKKRVRAPKDSTVSKKSTISTKKVPTPTISSPAVKPTPIVQTKSNIPPPKSPVTVNTANASTPSGQLVKRAPTGVTPYTVDIPQGEKVIGTGSGIQVDRKALPGPSNVSSSTKRGLSVGGKALGVASRVAGAGSNIALAVLPDTSREAPDADKPKNYPGSGMSVEKPAKSLNIDKVIAGDVSDPLQTNKPKIEIKPTFRDAKVPGEAPEKRPSAASQIKARIKTPVYKAQRTVNQPSEFLKGLKASAEKMKTATSDLSKATSKEVSAMSKFRSSFNDTVPAKKTLPSVANVKPPIPSSSNLNKLSTSELANKGYKKF